MVLVALAIRLAVVGFLYPDQMDPSRNHWHFAFENGKIAYSIVQGHGFGSPLFENTGPTAWQVPIYPYLMAGVFEIFGIYSKMSALVLLSMQALISALTCLPVFLVARKTFGDRVALFSGWAWALFPLGIYWPAERIWPTWLATLLLTILFLMTLNFERPASLRAFIGYGVLWGFTALAEPVVLTVLPVMLGWIGIRLWQQRERWFLPLTVASLAFILSVTPWFIRNYEVFHRFIPFRDSMGLEWHLGNNGDTSYWMSGLLGIGLDPEDWSMAQRRRVATFQASWRIRLYGGVPAKGGRLHPRQPTLVRHCHRTPFRLYLDPLLELQPLLLTAGA